MRHRFFCIAALAASTLLTLHAADTEWLTYGGNHAAWRFSDLTQINTTNVARLAPRWIFQTNVAGNQETSPIVSGGMMYITAPSNHAFALDLRTGQPIWHYSSTSPKPLDLCCGEVNRGFALLGKRLFKVNIEDTLVALDSLTGQTLWRTELGDYRKGFSGTLAPLVVKGKILVGTGGAEFGTRGFVDAYSPETGERLWRTYTVPVNSEPGSETWTSDAALRVGGSTWITGTYDPDLNLTYWGTGNPGPDMNGDVRPGDNLYTCSLIALDPDTGKMRWHFQFTPHDTHDWDAVADPVLVDLTIGGKKVKAVIQANRNGYFYALDRTNGKFLFARPYTNINWSKGIGPDGKPQVIAGLEPSGPGTKVCPGLGGGHNWEATAYSPQTGLFYFGSADGCQNFYRNDSEFVEGAWYQLSGTENVRTDPPKGSFIAMDAATGDIRWRFDMVRQPSGGALATAGGLVFVGDHFGNLIGFDARTGKVLWRYQTGAPISAPPISYTLEGKQYIALAAGGAMLAFALP
jgi:alcohol dehydrogenase (cytochrome c)